MLKQKRGKNILEKHAFVNDILAVSAEAKLAYQAWHGMIKRVHSKLELKKYPTYKGCSICVEWKKFSNFLEWHKKNYRPGFHLDKDIMFAGNKKYSPTRCRYIPSRINTLLLASGSIRGKYPQGVHLHTKSKLFVARVRLCDGTRDKYIIGHYTTADDASRAYRRVKADVIKRVATEEYKAKNISKEIRDRLFLRADKGKF